MGQMSEAIRVDGGEPPESGIGKPLEPFYTGAPSHHQQQAIPDRTRHSGEKIGNSTIIFVSPAAVGLVEGDCRIFRPR